MCPWNNRDYEVVQLHEACGYYVKLSQGWWVIALVWHTHGHTANKETDAGNGNAPNWPWVKRMSILVDSTIISHLFVNGCYMLQFNWLLKQYPYNYHFAKLTNCSIVSQHDIMIIAYHRYQFCYISKDKQPCLITVELMFVIYYYSYRLLLLFNQYFFNKWFIWLLSNL